MSENTRQQRDGKQQQSPNLSSHSEQFPAELFGEQPDLSNLQSPQNILNMQQTLGNHATVNFVAPGKVTQRKTPDFSNLRMARSTNDQPDVDAMPDEDYGNDFTPNHLDGLAVADPSDGGSSAEENNAFQQTTTINHSPIADPTWQDDYSEQDENHEFAPTSTNEITGTNPPPFQNDATNTNHTSIQREPQPLSRAEQAKNRHTQRVAQPSPQADGKIQRWSVWGAVKSGASWVGDKAKSGAKWVGDKVQQGAEFAFKNALKLAGVPAKMVMGFLKKAGGLFMSIVKNPGGFLKNLIGGIGQGFQLFSGNILKHLKSGFMGWLFGALSGAGIDIPSTFDMKSILTMVMQIIGVTAQNIKLRLAKFIGEKNVDRIEKAWGIISQFMSNGVGGLWDLIKTKLTNLKEMVIGQIKQWVITSIIKNAVIKIASMFNPVSGLVSIISMIYNVIRFVMERGKQIASLIQAIVGAVGAIASGNVTKMAKRIESALAKAIPVAIGFFSRLIGLGGITGKIRAIIMKVKKPVDKALDKVIGGVANKVKKLFKGKDDKKDAGAKGDPSKSKQAQKQAGFDAIRAEQKKYLNKKGQITLEEAKKVVASAKKKHPVFTSITVMEKQGRYDYHYITRDTGDLTGAEQEVLPADLKGIVDVHHANVDKTKLGEVGYHLATVKGRVIISRNPDRKKGPNPLPQLHINDKGIITKGASPDLRDEAEMSKNLGSPIDDFERHHIIPVNVFRDHPVTKLLDVAVLNQGYNLIYLPKNAAGRTRYEDLRKKKTPIKDRGGKDVSELIGRAIHSGSHDNWDSHVKIKLNELSQINDKAELARKVAGLQENLFIKLRFMNHMQDVISS